MKQDVDWAGNRVAQLQSHVQDVEDSENDDGLLDCVNRKTRMNMMTPMTMMMMGVEGCWECLSQVQSHTLRMGDRVGLFCKVISINDVLLMCVKNIVQNFSAIF